MNNIPVWAGILLVLGVLGVLMTGLSAWQRHRKPHPELTRKLVHVGMGLTTLSFPWLFHSPWPVIALGAMAAALLAAVKLSPGLKKGLGSVLGGVERASLGDIYFPVAVAVLFAVTRGDPVLFIVPMLILTFGDAVAAIVGVRYGLSRYQAEDGMKSAEGSAALFAVAFLSVLLPLLLVTQTGRIECVLIALTLAVLAAQIEAISWGGLDNLFLPLGAYALLHKFLGLSTLELAARLGVIAGLVVFVILWRRRTTLKDSALLGAALAGYVCWAIGGVHWLLPPLIVFVAYPLFGPSTTESRHRTHGMKSVLGVSAVGLAWLFAADVTHRRGLLFPFGVAFAIQLALVGIVRNKHYRSKLPDAVLVLGCSLVSGALVLGPQMLWIAQTRSVLVPTMSALAIVILMSAWFVRTRPILGDARTDTWLLLRQAVFAGIGSLAAWLAGVAQSAFGYG
jgi:phytol kinase